MQKRVRLWSRMNYSHDDPDMPKLTAFVWEAVQRAVEENRIMDMITWDGWQNVAQEYPDIILRSRDQATDWYQRGEFVNIGKLATTIDGAIPPSTRSTIAALGIECALEQAETRRGGHICGGVFPKWGEQPTHWAT